MSVLRQQRIPPAERCGQRADRGRLRGVRRACESPDTSGVAHRKRREGGIMHSEKDLIPLSEAAYLAVRRISLLSDSKIGTESQRLDTAAIALSVDVPIYAIDDRGALRRIDQKALLTGRIRDGGRRLVFGDKRAPITGLVVVKDEALKALDGLAALNIARAVNASDSTSRDGEDGR